MGRDWHAVRQGRTRGTGLSPRSLSVTDRPAPNDVGVACPSGPLHVSFLFGRTAKERTRGKGYKRLQLLTATGVPLT